MNRDDHFGANRPSLTKEIPHMNDDLLDRLARRDVDEDELRGLEAHFADCFACAERAADRAGAARAQLRGHLLADAPAPLEHPGRDELARFTRRALDPAAAEIVESHLDECEACARSIGELRIRRRAVARRAWLSAAAAIVVAILAALLTRRTAPPPTVEPAVVKHDPSDGRTQPPAAPRAQIATAYANPEWNELVQDAAETGRVPLPRNLGELRGDVDVLRGSGTEAEHLSPAGNAVEDVRPEFSWTPLEGATYTVFVFDGDRQIARSAALRAPRWIASSDLPRGRTLTWQVEAERGETVVTIPRPPAPAARFRVITNEEQRELSLARDLHPHDDLLLGLLYARGGMLDEARASLERAANRNPAARKLLAAIPRE
jgi:hypothetical protein